MLSAPAIAVFAPLPYLTASLGDLVSDENSVAATDADQAAWLRAVLYVHIGGGALALLLSPLHFAARLRARSPRLHRAVGRTTLAAIIVSGAAGLVMAPLIPAQIATGTADAEAFDRAYLLVPLLCWVPNLLTEYVLTHRPTTPRPRRRERTPA